MPKNNKHNKKYSNDFILQTIELIKTKDQSISSIARDLDISSSTLHGWVKRYHTKKPQNSHNSKISELSTNSDQEKIKSLERENKRLLTEREILKKAMAYFIDLPK